MLDPLLKEIQGVVPAEIKAKELLCEILPQDARQEFLQKD
jgi:hypothetical protein